MEKNGMEKKGMKKEEMKNMIVLENLSKRYGAKKAVDGINLTVKEGEMLSLLGVNGAGKSTTIKMLSCLTKPSGGTAGIDGRDVVKDRDHVKEIVGISTQDTAIARNLTVEENLSFDPDFSQLLQDTMMMGADYYQTESEIASLLAQGKVPIGVGQNTKIR